MAEICILKYWRVCVSSFCCGLHIICMCKCLCVFCIVSGMFQSWQRGPVAFSLLLCPPPPPPPPSLSYLSVPLSPFTKLFCSSHIFVHSLVTSPHSLCPNTSNAWCCFCMLWADDSQLGSVYCHHRRRACCGWLCAAVDWGAYGLQDRWQNPLPAAATEARPLWAWTGPQRLHLLPVSSLWCSPCGRLPWRSHTSRGPSADLPPPTLSEWVQYAQWVSLCLQGSGSVKQAGLYEHSVCRVSVQFLVGQLL